MSIFRSVKVIIDAKVDCDVMLTLSYVVSNASWMPAYDVRVFSKDKLIKVQECTCSSYGIHVYVCTQ